MKLTHEEEALLAGERGPAAQWAIGHQIKVGRYLGARDFVPVSPALKADGPPSKFERAPHTRLE